MSESTLNETSLCGWRCGDTKHNHKHFTVIVREKGKLLGRLTPEGGTTNRRIYAAVLSEARAKQIASEINSDPPFPGVTATAKPF